MEHIKRNEQGYFIENPMTYVYEVGLQSIDKCEMVELQDVPIEVTNEQEIEACK